MFLRALCLHYCVSKLFSANGNMLDTTRSQLLPPNIEILVCIDDWKCAQD